MVPETSEIFTSQAAKKKKKINNCEEINYHTRDKTKKSSFPFSLPSSKLTISPISIYKPYAIDIADTCSMQDACHMNFVIDFPPSLPWSLCGSVVERIGARNPKESVLSRTREDKKKISFSINYL